MIGRIQRLHLICTLSILIPIKPFNGCGSCECFKFYRVTNFQIMFCDSSQQVRLRNESQSHKSTISHIISNISPQEDLEIPRKDGDENLKA